MMIKDDEKKAKKKKETSRANYGNFWKSFRSQEAHKLCLFTKSIVERGLSGIEKERGDFEPTSRWLRSGQVEAETSWMAAVPWADEQSWVKISVA